MQIKHFQFSFFLNSAYYFFFIYIWQIVPEQLQFQLPSYDSLTFSEMTASLLVIFCVSIVIPHKLVNPGDLFFSLCIFTLIIPLLALRSGTTDVNPETVSETLIILLSGLFLTYAFSIFRLTGLNTIQVPSLDIQIRRTLTILFWIALLSLTLVLVVVGISGLSFDYSQLYSRRFSFRNIYGISVISYVVVNLNIFVLPAIASLGLYLKKRYAIYLSAFGILFMFALDGTRNIIFRVAIISILFFATNAFSGYKLVKIFYSGALLAFTVTVFLSQQLRATDIGSLIYDLLVRRVIFAPALISVNYTDFVQNFGITNFAQNQILAKLFGQEFVPISFRLGSLYQGSSENNLSVNVWSNAHLSGGKLGLLIISILLGLLIKFINVSTRKLSNSLRLPLFGTILLNYLEQNFLTAFLSGGITLALILAFYLRGDKSQIFIARSNLGLGFIRR